MQLAGMRDEHLAPTTAGVCAVSGLKPDLDRPFCDVVAKARSAFGATRAHGLDAATPAAECGFDDAPGAVIEGADRLVPRHKRIASERVEVQRRVAADRGEI